MLQLWNAKELQLQLPMLAGQEILLYNDKKDGTPYLENVTIGEDGELSLSIQPKGGVVLVE